MPILMRGDKVQWKFLGGIVKGVVELCDEPQEGFCQVRLETGDSVPVRTERLQVVEEADDAD